MVAPTEQFIQADTERLDHNIGMRSARRMPIAISLRLWKPQAEGPPWWGAAIFNRVGDFKSPLLGSRHPRTKNNALPFSDSSG